MNFYHSHRNPVTCPHVLGVIPVASLYILEGLNIFLGMKNQPQFFLILNFYCFPDLDIQHINFSQVKRLDYALMQKNLARSNDKYQQIINWKLLGYLTRKRLHATNDDFHTMVTENFAIFGQHTIIFDNRPQLQPQPKFSDLNPPDNPNSDLPTTQRFPHFNFQTTLLVLSVPLLPLSNYQAEPCFWFPYCENGFTGTASGSPI